MAIHLILREDECLRPTPSHAQGYQTGDRWMLLAQNATWEAPVRQRSDPPRPTEMIFTFGVGWVVLLVWTQWHSGDMYICIVAKMAQLATMIIEEASATRRQTSSAFISVLDCHLYGQ
jgi:hypothetical protein